MPSKAEEVVNRWDKWMRKCGELIAEPRPDLWYCGCWFDMRDPGHPYHGHFKMPESGGPLVCSNCFHKNAYEWPRNDPRREG